MLLLLKCEHRAEKTPGPNEPSAQEFLQAWVSSEISLLRLDGFQSRLQHRSLCDANVCKAKVRILHNTMH